MLAVNHAVSQIGAPHRQALHMMARNLCLGVSVWSSPRLPTGPELEAIKREARAMLVRRLRGAGVMDDYPHAETAV